jgi:PAS domain-containing protein
MRDFHKRAARLLRHLGARDEKATGSPDYPEAAIPGQSSVDYTKYAALLAQFSPDIIYQLDADGNVVFISQAVRLLMVNPGYLRAMGWSWGWIFEGSFFIVIAQAQLQIDSSVSPS